MQSPDQLVSQIIEQFAITTPEDLEEGSVRTGIRDLLRQQCGLPSVAETQRAAQVIKQCKEADEKPSEAEMRLLLENAAARQKLLGLEKRIAAILYQRVRSSA